MHSAANRKQPLAGLALVALLGATLVPAVHAAPALAPLKALQAQKLAREPMHEKREASERHEELRRLARMMKRRGVTQFSTAGLRSKPDVIDEDAPRIATPGAARRAATRTAATAPPVANRRANDPSGDLASGSGQSETSIVAWGNRVIAAWNDGEGFVTAGAGQGYATSVDGGLTWIDRGNFPVGSGAGFAWTSDPVLAVNEKTGAFYYTGLYDTDNGATSGVGIIKGRMDPDGSMTWNTPVAIRTVSATTDFIDKQWVAADSASGKVYVSYTRFPAAGSVVNFQASSDSNATSWGSSVAITGSGDNGLVQGSRPIVAGDGTVYVQYYKIGPVDADFVMVKKSVNQGVSFGTAQTAVSYFTNYGSGAPGFNRDQGIQFAGIAVDRSNGPRRGRLYVSFSESLNWYDDEPSIGTGGTVSETESNNSPASANAFTVGQVLTGSVTTGDLDYFSFPLTAGQSVIFESTVAPGTGTSNVTLRLYAPNGTTRLALTTANSQGNGVFLFTAPVAGTYYFRVAANGASGSYSVKTGAASNSGERGRDQRDAFVTFSDNGSSWSTPVRVSQSPVGYDDWLPEVAVDGNGRVYCAWFDFRDAAAGTGGGQSNTYLAFSDDGSTNWSQVGATSDAASDWSNVNSNIAPNQGDYIALFANSTNVYACWGDGRDGNPNVYLAPWTIAQTTVPTALALVSATAAAGRVDLEWFVDAAPGFQAQLERGEEGVFAPLSTLASDGDGHLRYTDRDVVAGRSYQYRLAIASNGATRYYGATTITVPLEASFALEPAFPNPAAGEFAVSFALASPAPATLTLIDVSGRVVLTRTLNMGAGRHVVPLSGTRNLAAGVYLVRLSQGDRSLTQRVSLVR
jgi:hypothetical protein